MSTCEAAITFSIVLMMLTFLILAPQQIASNALNDCRDLCEEICFYMDDTDIYSEDEIDGVTVYGTSPEKLNTMLTGLSDSYRIFYSIIAAQTGDTD